jgi:hypothetical protein
LNCGTLQADYERLYSSEYRLQKRKKKEKWKGNMGVAQGKKRTNECILFFTALLIMVSEH